MFYISVGLCNLNSTVGDTSNNLAKALKYAQMAHQQDLSFLVYPEQVMSGYPCEDWVLFPSFMESQKNALETFVRETAFLNPLFIIGCPLPINGKIYNCGCVVWRGQLWGIVPKQKLPLYGVFHEKRTISTVAPYHYQEIDSQVFSAPINKTPFGDMIFSVGRFKFAIDICEDLWTTNAPIERRSLSGASMIFNLSASPFRSGIEVLRKNLVIARSYQTQTSIVYANSIGGNDGLVFDGGGYVAQNGELVFSAKRFCEGIQSVHLDIDKTLTLRNENSSFRFETESFEATSPQLKCISIPTIMGRKKPQLNHYFFLPNEFGLRSNPTTQKNFCEELLNALILGLGDYFEKTAAFDKICLALSGGRDSLLCLLIAYHYLQHKSAALPQREKAAFIQDKLRVFYMPTVFSSSERKKAAQAATDTLGLFWTESSIQEEFEKEIEKVKGMLQSNESVSPITLQNIQARIRGERMWNISNSLSGLFIQTSNMSERAVGYTTVGGDLMGGFSPIANLPKTVVQYLLDYIANQPGFEFVRLTLLSKPSAELSPDQSSEQELMPFEILDACIYLIVQEKKSVEDAEIILTQTFPHEEKSVIFNWVNRFMDLFQKNIYKWVQAPISIYAFPLSLERDRMLQLPVVGSNDWVKK